MSGDLLVCPHCNALLDASARFCPSCGEPRTQVREELERAAAATGIPYQRLLAQARDENTRNPRPLTTTPQPAPTQANTGTITIPTTLSLPVLAMAGCAALVIIGSLGPWASVLFASVSGMDGDGQITIVLGIIAGVVSLMRLVQPNERRGLIWLAFLAFCGATAIGAYDWNNISDVAGESDLVTVRVGWGIQLVTIGGGIGAILAIANR